MKNFKVSNVERTFDQNRIITISGETNNGNVISKTFDLQEIRIDKGTGAAMETVRVINEMEKQNVSAPKTFFAIGGVDDDVFPPRHPAVVKYFDRASADGMLTLLRDTEPPSEVWNNAHVVEVPVK
jgi:hypothetical protein